MNADSERRRQIRRLLAATVALLSRCGLVVADVDGIVWSLLGGVVMFLVIRRAPPGLVLHAIGVRPVAHFEAPHLYQTLIELRERAGVDRTPKLYWVGERFPVAFTIGSGEDTTIALSDALVRKMTPARSLASSRTKSSPCAMAT